MSRPASLVTTGALLLAACDSPGPTASAPAAEPVFSASQVISHEQVPFAQTVFAPCAAGGAGEFIDLSGTFDFLTLEVFPRFGMAVSKVQGHPHGVTGIGESTGDIYRLTGSSQDIMTLTPGETETFVNNDNVIGPGPNNNLKIQEVFHATVNAQGTLTAIFDHIRVICQ